MRPRKTPAPTPITPNHHPDCVRVITSDDIDIFSAFNMAADLLRPDNTKERGLVWIPREDPVDTAHTSAQANAGNLGYFESLKNFGRDLISSHLFCTPGFDFKKADDVGVFISTNRNDDAAIDADKPHIDGMSRGHEDPHSIRAVRLLHGYVDNDNHRRPAGTIVFDGVINQQDVDFNGRVLGPGVNGPQGREKLGQAWQIANHRAILFMNVGGPVSCQLPHMAQVMPVQPYVPPEIPTLITRVIETYDFGVKT